MRWIEVESSFLFKKLYKDGNPLFKSQSELRREIMKLPGSDFKSENTLIVYTSMVLCGYRRMSDRLKECIFLVLQKRVGDEEYPGFKSKFLEVYNQFKKEIRVENDEDLVVAVSFNVEFIVNGYIASYDEQLAKVYFEEEALKNEIFDLLRKLKEGESLLIKRI